MKRQHGMTIIELLIVICIMCILATIGVIQLVRARGRGYEASAIASLRIISSGQLAYSASCGQGGFAPDLTLLSRPSPRTSVPFVPVELSAGAVTMKSGYLFTVRPAITGVPYRIDCFGTRNTSVFYATARPANWSASGGTQAFATHGDGLIWSVYAAVPPTEPFGPPARPIQ